MRNHIIGEAEKERFDREGYVVVRGLFGKEEIDRLREHFMNLHSTGPVPGLFKPVREEEAGGDILKVYPRFMHPHKADELSKRMLLDSRVFRILRVLFGEEPIAAQSMFYYKPPGAKGQALHQDNFYLKIEPGTCIAAWIAVDRSDEENGGLYVVPRSQQCEIQCPHEADQAQSFTDLEVDVPAGLKPVPAILEPGDTLFFGGNVIHGSYPNLSKDRFRRSFIGHYLGASSEKAGRYYRPLLREDGSEVEMEWNESGPCGNEFAASSPSGVH